jgi:hypothetical protein
MTRRPDWVDPELFPYESRYSRARERAAATSWRVGIGLGYFSRAHRSRGPEAASRPSFRSLSLEACHPALNTF